MTGITLHIPHIGANLCQKEANVPMIEEFIKNKFKTYWSYTDPVSFEKQTTVKLTKHGSEGLYEFDYVKKCTTGIFGVYYSADIHFNNLKNTDYNLREIYKNGFIEILFRTDGHSSSYWKVRIK